MAEWKIMGLLSAAKAKLQKILVRKSRPWTLDDFLALGSWLFVGNGLFLLIGTTSFASVILFLAKSLHAQEVIVEKLTNHLSHSTGIKVSFNSPISPNWRDRMLTLQNVRVMKEAAGSNGATEYDLHFSRIDLKISLLHFLEGKGWVESCSVDGVRGYVDRTRSLPSSTRQKYVAQQGDFYLKGLTVKDTLITFLYRDFRPFSFSIISAEFDILRKQWLLLDLLSAKSIVGFYDGCLFSLHTPQLEDGRSLEDRKFVSNMRHFKIDGMSIDHIKSRTFGPLSWITRGNVDFNILIRLPLDVEKTSLKKLKESIVVSLIRQMDKKPDLVSEIKLDDEMALSEVSDYASTALGKFIFPISKYLKSVQEEESLSLTLKSHIIEKDQRVVARNFLVAPADAVVFKVDMKLKNLHAAYPSKVDSLSFLNSAIIRPTIGYMNQHKPGIPISTFFELSTVAFL